MHPTENPSRVLIVTQAIDTDNPVMGFFHNWIRAFAESPSFSHVVAIGLEVGSHTLPSNVDVYSLGKETGKKTKLSYALKFLRLIWTHRNAYDAVLIHMNQEYVLLGGLLWKYMRKPVFFWRNHYQGDWKTDLALRLCTETYYTSRYSYNATHKKAHRMPVGVNTSLFFPTGSLPDSPTVLSLGRISPSKNLELLLEALGMLQKDSVTASVSLYGNGNPNYIEKLKSIAQGSNLDAQFYGAIPNRESPMAYRAHRVFVNTSKSGMLDKTILEAMACGCLALSCNKDLAKRLPAELSFTEGDAAILAAKLKRLFELEPIAANVLQDRQRIVVEEESLEKLSNILPERIRTYVSGQNHA